MAIEGHAEEKYVTGRRIGSSRGRGWTNVLAERWSHARGELPTVLPRDTEVAVLLSGRTLIDREGAGLKQRNHGRRGTAWLCPAGIREDFIDFRQPLDDCLHVFLPAEPFEAMIEQDLEADPKRVTLRYEVLAHDAFVEQVALQIARELDHESAAGALLIEGLGRALSAHLVNQCSEIALPRRLALPRERPLDARRRARVLDYIEAHVKGDFSVADLASIACMSPAHFARCFKASLGLAPHAYVSARRLARAQEHLSDGTRNIAAVAEAAGFSNAANFARAFKRATGLSPTEYRALGRSGEAGAQPSPLATLAS